MPTRTKTSDIIDNLLMGVALSTTFAITIAAPNGLRALEKPLTKLINGRDKRREARRIGTYLKQQKLVKISENSDGSFQITLNEKGRKRVSRIRFDRLVVSKSHWDQKWRIIMFDIPEEHKTMRDYISRHLKRIGFKQLQRSAFVFPYPVDEFMDLLRELFPEVSRHVVYLVADDIDTHNTLVKDFRSIL